MARQVNHLLYVEQVQTRLKIITELDITVKKLCTNWIPIYSLHIAAM